MHEITPQERYVLIAHRSMPKFKRGLLAKPSNLAPLSYAYDYLEPSTTQKQEIASWQKHHQVYVNNLNAAIVKYPDSSIWLRRLYPRLSLVVPEVNNPSSGYQQWWRSAGTTRCSGEIMTNQRILNCVLWKRLPTLNLVVKMLLLKASPLRRQRVLALAGLWLVVITVPWSYIPLRESRQLY